ncbi:hypothetical protein Hanom_Chr16g01462281 [Helianthus anomalus]
MQIDPEIIVAAQDTNTADFDFEFNFPIITLRSEPESSSHVRFDVGSSSGAGVLEHDEAAMRFATDKMMFIEQGDNDKCIYRC